MKRLLKEKDNFLSKTEIAEITEDIKTRKNKLCSELKVLEIAIEEEEYLKLTTQIQEN
jgi:hypothetical protein